MSNLENKTLAEVRKMAKDGREAQAALCGISVDSLPPSGGDESEEILKVGATVLIQTVTYHYIGKIEKIITGEGKRDAILAPGGCWMAVSERFGKTLSAGTYDEAESFGDTPGSVNLNSYIMAFPWKHSIPVTK